MADLVVIGPSLAGTAALDTEALPFPLGDRAAIGDGGKCNSDTVDANMIWLASNIGSNYTLARLTEETQPIVVTHPGIVLHMELSCKSKASVWRCFDETNGHRVQMHRHSQTSTK